MTDLSKLATYLLASRLYAHLAHHLAKGAAFVGDHELLGMFYAQLDEDYDAVVELQLAIGPKPDLVKIASTAAAELEEPDGNEAAFRALLQAEKQICTEIRTVVRGASDGTQSLLQRLAENSERDRQYKMVRRLSS